MGFKKNSAAAVPLKQEPARQALGAAIEQRAAAERDRTDAGARLAQAEAALTDAVTSLRDTKAEVAKVTSAAVESAMMGAPGSVSSDLRQAKANEVAAAENAEISCAARDRILEDMPAIDEEVAAAKRQVAAMSPEVFEKKMAYAIKRAIIQKSWTPARTIVSPWRLEDGVLFRTVTTADPT